MSTRHANVGPCAVEGCEKRSEKKSLCGKHYKRLRLYGDPNFVKTCEHGQPAAFIDAAMSANTDECINWPHSFNSNGYGQINICGSPAIVPRVILARSLGRPLSDGELTRHKCDNRKCINPRHIEVGSHLDNVRDMDSRGRRVTVWLKLNEGDVVKIRERLAAGETMQAIARSFSVRPSTIAKIRDGKTWKHVGGS